MVGHLYRVAAHLARLRAGAAADALVLVNLVSEHGNRIEYRVNRPQGADIFAEGTVNDYGQKNGYGKQYILPDVKPAQDVMHGLIQQDQGDAALQRPSRADKLAEVGRALPQDIHQKHGKQDNEDCQNDVF